MKPIFIYSLLIALGIPWWWPASDQTIVLGVPAWVLSAIVFSVFASIYTALLLAKPWQDD